MSTHGSRLNSFLQTTGAAVVCGYTEDVSFIEAIAFELLFFSGLQYETLARFDLLEKFNKSMKQTAPGLYKSLGFRMKIRKPSV